MGMVRAKLRARSRAMGRESRNHVLVIAGRVITSQNVGGKEPCSAFLCDRPRLCARVGQHLAGTRHLRERNSQSQNAYIVDFLRSPVSVRLSDRSAQATAATRRNLTVACRPQISYALRPLPALIQFGIAIPPVATLHPNASRYTYGIGG